MQNPLLGSRIWQKRSGFGRPMCLSMTCPRLHDAFGNGGHANGTMVSIENLLPPFARARRHLGIIAVRQPRRITWSEANERESRATM